MGSTSANEDDWVVLRDHVTDTSLSNSPMSVAAWSIETKTSFRRFRVFLTGPNAHGGNHLMCSGIELYGLLTIA